MIREIEKPKIDFKFYIDSNNKYYYDEENEEYFLKTKHRSKRYFNLEGNFHRIGKPAIEYCDGEKQWRENGKCHRLDGPSYISKNCIQFWIKNICYSTKSFTKETNHLVCGNCGGFCRQECFI